MGVMSLVGVNCIHAGICLMFYSSHFLLVRSHLCPNLSFNPTDLKILKPDKSDYIGVISRWCLGKYKSQKPSHKFDNFLSFKVIIKSNDFKNKMFDPDIKSDWNTHLWNLVILCKYRFENRQHQYREVPCMFSFIIHGLLHVSQIKGQKVNAL